MSWKVLIWLIFFLPNVHFHVWHVGFVLCSAFFFSFISRPTEGFIWLKYGGLFPWHFSTRVVGDVYLPKSSPLGGHRANWFCVFFIWTLWKFYLCSVKNDDIRTNGESGQFDTNEWRKGYDLCSQMCQVESSQHSTEAVLPSSWGIRWWSYTNVASLVLAMAKIEPGQVISHLSSLSPRYWTNSS